MDEQKVRDFVYDYVQGADLQNCVSFALDNDFEEPDDYGSYGCNIGFISEEDSSVKDRESLEQWYVAHANKYLKPKMEIGDPMGFSFPPAFNFPDKSDFELEPISDDEVEVVVAGSQDYTFVVQRDEAEEEGMVITAIKFSVWGSDGDLLQ